MKEQLTNIQKENLKKQGYRIVGNHSAVKTCAWTRNMIRGKGGCYKYTFYGIRSHQCMQMTTSMFCASRCKFCWRGQKAPVSKENWYGPIDSPKHIIGHAIDAHIGLLQGFKGYNKSVKKHLDEINDVCHVALSLTGEPITYPKINEILKEFHKRKISTFLVTNAQYPEQLKKIKDVTQLYLSIDAPTKELMKRIDRPLLKDFWERTNKCLEILKTRKYRTCIRLTMIKDENMENHQDYAKLIKKAMPDFIELKSYMWVGEGREIYTYESMPNIDEIKEFSEKILKYLPDYEYAEKHTPSRAILLMKKTLKKKRWINFPKFFNLVNQKKSYKAEDYSSKIMMPNK